MTNHLILLSWFKHIVDFKHIILLLIFFGFLSITLHTDLRKFVMETSNTEDTHSNRDKVCRRQKNSFQNLIYDLCIHISSTCLKFFFNRKCESEKRGWNDKSTLQKFWFISRYWTGWSLFAIMRKKLLETGRKRSPVSVTSTISTFPSRFRW